MTDIKNIVKICFHSNFPQYNNYILSKSISKFLASKCSVKRKHIKRLIIIIRCNNNFNNYIKIIKKHSLIISKFRLLF